jgi:phospholipase C
VYTGPGFRLPFYIISPWTRGGNVYVEHADHSSQIKFIEQVYAAKGKDIVTSQIPAWRRANMADLTKAFDFEHPDYSIPSMPNASYPSTDEKGNWNGYAVCESTYRVRRPPVPYGKQSEATSLVTEDGFKEVRGQLTEGRYLVFEMNGYALASSSGALTVSKATSSHNTKSQRFVISGSASTFTLKDVNGKTMSSSEEYTIVDMGNGEGYSIKKSTGQYVAINKQGKLTMEKTAKGFATFSVTYGN